MDSTLDLRARLQQQRPLLLDGALGTELERRGAPCGLPLWSAHALLHEPELVLRIHVDYLSAGADLLTANSFRTQRRSLAKGGLGDRAAELTKRAIGLARQAAQAAAAERRIWVAGSAPTLEDCYRPDLVPTTEALEAEHAEHAMNLAAGGADLILVETMNCVREAVIAVRASRTTGLPVWVSFVCGEGSALLSGEPLTTAVTEVLREEPDALLVNCLPPPRVERHLPALRESGLPYGAYPNLGAPGASPGAPRSHDCTPLELADLCSRWLREGARLIGGCCGTKPDHIRALHALRN